MRRLARCSLLAFVFTVPLDVWAVPGVGSLATATGIALCVFGAAHAIYRGRVRPPLTEHVLLLALTAWTACTYVWSVDSDATVQRAATYAQLCVIVLLMWQIIRDESDASMVILVFVLGAAVAAVGTLQAYARNDVYDLDVRYAARGYDPNDLGLTLAIGLAMAWRLASDYSGWKRAVGLTYVPLSLLAIVLSASRSALLATMVAATGALLTSRRRGPWPRLLVLGLGVGAAAMVLRYAPEESWQRLFTIRDELAGGTLTHRTTIWRAGLDIFAENWILGVGAGAFPSAVEPLLNWKITAHNTLLAVAAELGVVGLLLFVAAFAGVVRRLVMSQSRWAVTMLAVLATWAVGASSLTWDYRKTTWLVLALSMAIARVVPQADPHASDTNAPRNAQSAA